MQLKLQSKKKEDKKYSTKSSACLKDKIFELLPIIQILKNIPIKTLYKVRHVYRI